MMWLLLGVVAVVIGAVLGEMFGWHRGVADTERRWSEAVARKADADRQDAASRREAVETYDASRLRNALEERHHIRRVLIAAARRGLRVSDIDLRAVSDNDELQSYRNEQDRETVYVSHGPRSAS